MLVQGKPMWKIIDLMSKLFKDNPYKPPDKHRDRYSFHIPYVEFCSKEEYEKFIKAGCKSEKNK
jgi:hypothetical protein